MRATLPGVKKILLTLALLGGVALAQTAPPAPAPAPAPTAPAPTPPAPAAPAPSAPAAPVSTGDPAAVVGKVGAQSYTLADFDQAFRIAAARVVNAQGIPFEDAYLAEFAEARPDYLKQFLRDRAVTQLAQTQLAQSRLTVDQAAVDRQFEEARGNFETDEAFAGALAATGYSAPEALRAELGRQALVGAYLESLQERFKFGDAVVAGYYQLNRDKLSREAEACVKHILVPTEAEARAIVTELAGGADFARVAAEKSQDPGSAPQGGDLGCFGPGQMVPTFDRASFTGPVGQVQTVQSDFGYHVLVVTRRTDAGVLPLAEAAPLIRQQLASEAAQKYLDSQVARLNTQAFPEVVTLPVGE